MVSSKTSISDFTGFLKRIFKKIFYKDLYHYPIHLEIFSPIKISQFIENQKRQDLPVKFKDSDVFIKLPRNQVTVSDILFVSQSKEEIGAFQTNKYLQYPFLINADCNQSYPNDNFLSWASVRIDIENLN